MTNIRTYINQQKHTKFFDSFSKLRQWRRTFASNWPKQRPNIHAHFGRLFYRTKQKVFNRVSLLMFKPILIFLICFSFKRILDQTFSGLANIENRWFKNYVGIVAYDQEHGSSTSEVISKGNRLDFEVAINVSFFNGFMWRKKEIGRENKK